MVGFSFSFLPSLWGSRQGWSGVYVEGICADGVNRAVPRNGVE